MLHNIKKNNIDIFEVLVHVTSFQIHIHVQLQINLKCTDARPQSRQRLRCSHTQSMDVDEGSDQN